MAFSPGPLVWLGLNLATGGDITCTPTTGVVAFAGNIPTVTYGSATLAPGPLPWLGLNLTGAPAGTAIPQTGVVTFTGNVPGVAAGATLTGVTGTLTFTGNVPTVSSAANIMPTTGVVTFTGNQANVDYSSLQRATDHTIPAYWFMDLGYFARYMHVPVGIPQQNRDSVATFNYSPTTGVITFTGNVTTVGLNIDRSPNTGEVGFNGGIPVLTNPVQPQPSTGVITFTGNQPAIDTQALVSPTTGTLSFTGYAPSLSLASALSPSTGLVTFVGNVPTVDSQEQRYSPSTGLITFIGGIPGYMGATRTADLDRPAGGWLRKPKKRWYEELPTEEEVQAQREELDILPKKMQKVVKTVVKKATDGVTEKQAAVLASAYLEEDQQEKLAKRLNDQIESAHLKWMPEVFRITRAIVLDELRKKADAEELERILKMQEHEEVEVQQILDMWMKL